MRPIKFRAKRIDNGDLVYGDLWQYEGRTWMVPVIDGEAKRFEVDPETVGQYTGLDDIDENLIFDGSILEDDNGSLYIVRWYQSDCKYIAVNKEAYMSTLWNDSDDGFDLVWTECRVIGNIHDHLHLLGGESK